MSAGKIYEWLKALAALSGIVAFVAFAYTYSKDLSLRRAEAGRTWQAVEIYKLLHTAVDDGMTIDEISEKIPSIYIEQRKFDEIDPGVASKDQVIRALISLRSQNAIQFYAGEKYRISTEAYFGIPESNKAEIMQKAAEDLVDLVADAPLTYTENGLRALLEKDGFSDLEIMGIIMPMVSEGNQWPPPPLVDSNGVVAASPDTPLKLRGQ